MPDQRFRLTETDRHGAILRQTKALPEDKMLTVLRQWSHKAWLLWLFEGEAITRHRSRTITISPES